MAFKARVIARQKGKRKMGLGFHERRRQMWSKNRQLRQLVFSSTIASYFSYTFSEEKLSVMPYVLLILYLARWLTGLGRSCLEH